MLVIPNLSGVSPERDTSAPRKEMLSVRHDGNKTLVRINSSSVSLIQTCLRKSEYILKRQAVGRSENAATLFGSAIHAALEVWYTAPKVERKLPERYRENMELMLSGEQSGDHVCYRATRAFLDKMAPLSMVPDEDKRSMSAGIWLLSHYFETYAPGGREIDDFEVLRLDGKPAVELRLEHCLYDSPSLHITYFGTIDVILKNAVTDTILVCDHKTSSVVGTDFYNRLKPNHQYTGYLWLAQEALGLPTDKFLVNCLQVKPRPKTSRGLPPHFPRQVTTRSPEDIAEWRDVVTDSVGRYLFHMERDGWPLADPNACSMYRGCQFLPVCSAPHSLRESVLSNLFSQQGES